MSTVHVVPVGDLIEHDDAGDDCPCGPTVEPVFADDGYWRLADNTSQLGWTRSA